MSAVRAPCVLNGLVPTTLWRCSRRLAERNTAPSGIADVSKDTMPLNCRSFLLSPARIEFVFVRPPTLLDSLDSRTQPSSPPIEVNVTCTGTLTITVIASAPGAPLLSVTDAVIR